MDIITISFLTAIAIFILLMKLGIRKFTNHSVLTDVIVSGGLTILFIGTFTGMATALTAGIFISIMLYIAKMYQNFFGKKEEDEYEYECYIEGEEPEWD